MSNDDSRAYPVLAITAEATLPIFPLRMLCDSAANCVGLLLNVKQNLLSSILRERASFRGPMERSGPAGSPLGEAGRSGGQWGEVVAAQFQGPSSSRCLGALRALDPLRAADPGGGLHHAKNATQLGT